jgi:septum formation protein
MQARAITPSTPLLLGSGSPRRRDILRGLGIPIEVSPANTDEDVDIADPARFLERVVGDKLVAARRELERRAHCAAVLVADTIVVLDDEILGKPRDTSHAAELVSRLSGRSHTVFTRYAVGAGTETVARTVESQVVMRALSQQAVQRYAETGEGADKAGAYAIQGIGAFLVRSIVGSYTNVVGLPSCEVVEDFERMGLLDGFPLAGPLARPVKHD